MNRGAIAAGVVGAGAIAALVLFLTAPSTGPDLVAVDDLPPAPVVQPEATAVPASPAPRSKRPIARARVMANGAVAPGPGFRGSGVPGAVGGRLHHAPAAVRDRYTERGRERMMARVEAYADEHGWDDQTFEEVAEILDASAEKGRALVAEAREGDPLRRASVALDLQALRASELEELGTVLGDEAESFAKEAGLVRLPLPDAKGQQPIDE